MKVLMDPSQAEVDEALAEGAEELEGADLLGADPAGLGRLPTEAGRHVETLVDLGHDGPVGPPAVVVPVDGDHLVVAHEVADLLAKLAQRALEGVLALVERAPGDGPGAPLVGDRRPAGEEVPGRTVVVEVAEQQAGRAVAAPADGAVGQSDEPVSRCPDAPLHPHLPRLDRTEGNPPGRSPRPPAASSRPRRRRSRG